jgi:hypothetical protein
VNATPAFDSARAYQPGEVVREAGVEYVKIRAFTAQQAPPNAEHWRVLPFADLQDGPGFRVRQQGRVYGPYIPPDRFRVSDAAILDHFGTPILYFPARHRGDITIAGNYVGNTPQSMYNYEDNLQHLKHAVGDSDVLARNRMRVMLGDYNVNGSIDPGETARYTGPFILWSAGPGANFGPQSVTDNPNAAQIATNRRNAEMADRDNITNYNMSPR